MIPSRDAAGPSTVGWVSDPDGRGTLGLITSCLLTLSLCVWSALHLNIPSKEEGRRKYWLRRVKWSICGILIPEIVVLLAWRQWTSARRLTKEINRALNDVEQQSTSSRASSEFNLRALQGQELRSGQQSPHRRSLWTNVHSFYVGSGGFTFELKESEGGYGIEPFIPGPQRLTVTAHGALLLAKCGLLPDIHEREIKDKSKTDGMAKALVLLQAAWMLLQTLGRLVAGIPTTLLEVNTIAHILCAFVIYLLWWSKPREVHEPTVLKGDWVDSICAYMYMSSRISGTKIKGQFKPKSWVRPELEKYLYLDYGEPPSFHRQSSNLLQSVNAVPAMDMTTTTNVKVGSHSSGAFEFQPFRHLDSQRTIGRKLKMGWTPRPSNDNPTLRTKRHTLAAVAVQAYPDVRARFNKVTSNSTDPENTSPSKNEPIIEQLVVCEARNWPSDFLLPGLGGELMGMTLWFATMAYGGVHISAWHEYFPTHAEQLLWRFSSVYIASSGLLWLLMNILGALFSWAGVYWVRFISFQAWWIEYIIYGTLATICGVVYIFARAFLVVDSIFSLRRLPAQSYSTPQWSSIIPHLQ